MSIAHSIELFQCFHQNLLTIDQNAEKFNNIIRENREQLSSVEVYIRVKDDKCFFLSFFL